ncbi:MAG: hypothetical protein AB7F91_17920 [Parvularculaceae bacterium]
MLRILKICAISVLVTTLGQAAAAEVTEPLPEGQNRTLQIANTLHQVAIRLKSLGPGICSTKVLFSNEVYHYGAPPGIWSNWFKLSPAVAGVSVDISIAAECDGLVVGEVKYIKR